MTPASTDLPAPLKALVGRADDALARVLPGEDLPPTDLHKAMRYAVLGGGKRLRPLLVYAAGHALGQDFPEARFDKNTSGIAIMFGWLLPAVLVAIFVGIRSLWLRRDRGAA